MLTRWTTNGHSLELLPPDAPKDAALWIDLRDPDQAEHQEISALIPKVPGAGEMRDLELSHRYYRLENAVYMTLLLPGASPSHEGITVSSPVTFILTPTLLVTLRHHDPEPFHTLPNRTDMRLAPGQPARLFMEFCDEIVGQMADLLELTGDETAMTAQEIYASNRLSDPDRLNTALRRVGHKNETLAQIRAALLTLTRALRYFVADLSDPGPAPPELLRAEEDLLRDIEALEVHTDSLDARLGVLTDLTIGLIGLGDNQVTKALSMVAALFLPPTLIASIYGMNFEILPGLDHPFGFWLALAGMALASGGCWLFFRWRGWF